MTSMNARRKWRRWTRKQRRGRMLPAEATAISTRTRSPWPRTRAVTRKHPRLKTWRGYDWYDDYEESA